MEAGSKKVTSIISMLCLFSILLTLTSCGTAKKEPEINVSELECIHEPEFGGVYVKITIDDFNALGFEYGDSVKVTFSNGYELEDLPYYNGYYTKTGEPLLIAYPGYDYVKAAINNGDDLWEVAGLDETCKAEVSLNEHGKYLDIQDARNISYEDDRDKYSSDAVFANFRSVSAGKLKENILYRSASPCDNQHNRAGYVDALCEEAGVQFIVNLSDNEEKIAGYMSEPDFNSPYFKSLYENGQVIPLALNMNYGSDEFRTKVANGMIAIAEHDGPYLVHCTEGKDRTGFVCMLIEAFCGASYDEIVSDYMITYDNYYSITKESDKKKYDVLVESLLIPMIQSVVGDESVDIKKADLSKYAEEFLISAGMTNEQLDSLRDRLI